MTGPLAVTLRLAWSKPVGRAGLLLLGALALLAVFGPMALPDPAAQGDLLAESLRPPGESHLFGTDQLSRDVFARVASGLRLSLMLGVLAAVLAVTLGTLVGLVAGAWGGAIDAVLMRLVDALLAIPRLFVLLLALAVWDRTSRLVRGEARRLHREEFVRAAEALGSGRWRIAFRHLLPNVAGPVLVAATLGIGDVILLEAGLSFLGLGVRPPTPSLGGMIQESRSVFATAPWTSIFPGVAIVLAVLAVNLVGDALREALDPRSA